MSFQLLPALTEDEYEGLKGDIAERGVQVPVIVDEHGAVIDGHHRIRACQELGITDYPREVRAGLSDDEKAALALALNVHRRQLSRDQRRELVGELRRMGWSTRRIAKAVGVSQPTVINDLRQGIDQDLSMPSRVMTADGRTYPARRPATTEHVCDVCGEVLPRPMWHCDGCDEHYPTSQRECPACMPASLDQLARQAIAEYEAGESIPLAEVAMPPPLRDPTLMRQRWEILREAERRLADAVAVPIEDRIHAQLDRLLRDLRGIMAELRYMVVEEAPR